MKLTKLGKGFCALALACTLCVPAANAAETIKIGVIGAQSGDTASYGMPSLQAARVLAKEVNAKGGVLGRTVEVIPQDSACKAEMATNAATKLISERVDVVMGPSCSGPTKSAMPIFQNANVVVVSPTATAPGLTLDGKMPLFFRTVANDLAQARLTSKFLHEVLKVRKVAYIHDNDDYGKGFADTNKKYLEEAGVETALFEAINPQAVDFSSTVQKLRRVKPDVVVFGGYQPVASKLVRQMRRDRLNVPMIGPDGLKDETFLKMTGKDSEGVYASYPKDTSALPLYAKARKDFVDEYKQEPGFGYYNAYAAIQCLLAAIEKTGGTDTAKIVDALHTNPVETPLGKLTFNKFGDAAGMALSIYQVQGGKYVELEHNIVLD